MCANKSPLKKKKSTSRDWIVKHSPKILVCEEKATSTTIQLCTHTKLLPDAVAHAVALSVSVSVQMDMILMSLYKCQDKNGKKVLNPGSPGTGSWTHANSSTGHRPPVDCSSEWLLTPRYLWVFILLTAVGPSLERWPWVFSIHKDLSTNCASKGLEPTLNAFTFDYLGEYYLNHSLIFPIGLSWDSEHPHCTWTCSASHTVT